MPCVFPVLSLKIYNILSLPKENIEIQNSNIKLNSKDTFSIPIDTKLNISIDENEDAYLNCVSKI